MKSNLRQPCNDCPFRLNAVKGWLGAGDPDHFVNGALSDYPLPKDDNWRETGEFITALPCHQTVDYEDRNWRDSLDESEVCVGALAFCANTGKDPRDRERSRLVTKIGRRDDVFARPQEFINHHTSLGRGSWEGAKR